MSSNTPFQGSLFANEFLLDAVTRLEDWRDIGDDAVATFEASVRNVFDRFSHRRFRPMKARLKTI